jgi:hypothetical protein
MGHKITKAQKIIVSLNGGKWSKDVAIKGKGLSILAWIKMS